MARPQVENSVRSLSRLHKAGSTARVLDLLRVWENAQHDNEPIEKPIFTHPILNKSFVIKHRLRRNETDIFEDGRATATKVLLPLDLSNLDAGGRYIFVGQPNYIDILSDATGIDISARQSDLKVMRALDSLPSFDPFLLREWLAKFGVFPDPRYFELSLSSVAQMEAFVFVEISQLVSMSLSGHTQNESITRLVKKLLSSNPQNRPASAPRTTVRRCCRTLSISSGSRARSSALGWSPHCWKYPPGRRCPPFAPCPMQQRVRCPWHRGIRCLRRSQS